MDPRSVIIVIGITSAIVTCAPPQPRRSADVIVTGGCPAIPASWPQSTLSRSLGSSDPTLGPQTGALFVEVKGDGLNPSAMGAHLSLRSRAILRDTVVTDSVVTMTLLPAGRYSLGITRPGFRQLRASIEVRSGYLDTVRVVLATDMACLA
jgi:hypothetical protein